MQNWLAAILGVLAFILPGTALPQDGEWSARINSPFAGPLWRLATNGDQDLLAVSSADETITTWMLDQELARDRIALPRRKGLNYRARGLAIHPVSGLVAASLPPVRRGTEKAADGARIELRKPGQGSLAHRIESGLPTRPQSLAFSPDGNWLAAVLSEGCGLRVWNTGDWSLAFSDDHEHGGCGMPQATADTTELRFVDGDPVALLTSGETGVRRYELAGDAFLRTAYRPADNIIQRPDGLAVSPDRANVAVGDRRVHDPSLPMEIRVVILDAKTLEISGPPLKVTDTSYFYEDPGSPIAQQTQLNRIAWEKGLISAGGVLPCNGVLDATAIKGETVAGPLTNCVARWRLEDSGEPEFLPVGNEAVMDMLPLPGRNALAIATRNRIALHEPDGRYWLDDYGNVFESTSPFADFRLHRGTGRDLLAFDISDDGERIFFQQYGDRTGLTFDVGELSLRPTDQPDDDLRTPDIDTNLFGTIPKWLNSRSSGALPKDLLLENDVLRSVAAFDKGRYAVAGTADSLQVVDIANGKVLCRLRVVSEAFRVNVARDRRLAVVGHGDGTLRWYEIGNIDQQDCTLTERLAVNIRRAADDPGIWTWHGWIADTGQFAHDAAAKPDMAWQRTKADGTVETVDFSAVSSLYDREVLMTSLQPPSDKNPRQPAAGESREQKFNEIAELAKVMSVDIVDPPASKAVFSKNPVELTLLIEGQGPWPKQLDLRVDGKVGVTKIADGETYGPDEPVSVAGPGQLAVTITLPERVQREKGQFDLCYAIDGRLHNKCGTLTWNGDVIPPPKPRLWAVLVGFSDYSKSSRGSLKYAQNDALDFARLLAADQKTSSVHPGVGDFSGLHIDLIVEPTSADARTEIEQLKDLPFVTVREPTAGSIMAAVEEIGKKDKGEGLADDLVLFYFSGHGTSIRGTGGRNTLLLDPLAPDDLEAAVSSGNALPMSKLVDGLSKISAEQIVLVDACRSFSQVDTLTTIDPAFENMRLATRLNPANVVFSSRVGQYSPETSYFTFSKHRAKRANGNGIFGYAILDSLRNPEADVFKDAGSENRIEIDEVKRYLGKFFRGPARDYFKKVARVRKRFVAPDPVWIPSGGIGGTIHHRTILRTLTAPEN